jgi:hypothetical protein
VGSAKLVVMTTSDDDRAWVDEEPAEPPEHLDLEAPEADTLDQSRPVAPTDRQGPVSRGIDVPEADAIDQAMEVPLDDDEAPD